MDLSSVDSFEDFWPLYLNEHRNPLNRRIHVVGFVFAFILLLLFVALQFWSAIALCFVIGYGAAWVGHYFVERNRPATFKAPLWSLMGDIKLVYLSLSGRIDTEIVKFSLRD
jgi:hypothetical protein